jgi:squalene-associated FAD-dependent desaturase
MKVAVIGAGWAGCAAAVEATRLGHHVTLFEASRTLGGRARRVDVMHKGKLLALDNGQHILIGAYAETLKLMAYVGVDIQGSLLRLPLTLRFPDGRGLELPNLPAPFDALAGIVTARGWSWVDKLSLLKVAIGWQLCSFQCGAQQSVTSLCKGLTPSVMANLIEPLCVSALNTPAERASGQVFLRVMRDSLFSNKGGSNLLLPLVDLNALLPNAAAAWLQRQGGALKLGARVQSIRHDQSRWHLATQTSEVLDPSNTFDAVILACPPIEAARLVQCSDVPCDAWLAQTQALQHEVITTVYAISPGARLGQPMLALRASDAHPAQFVFDRGQLGGPPDLLAFVISASVGDSATLSQRVAAQAADQLGLSDVQLLQTIVEKRATFACTPGLQRPGMQLAQGLLACGDYVEGPYPATLEGAVRSGLAAARSL